MTNKLKLNHQAKIESRTDFTQIKLFSILDFVPSTR